MGDTVKVGDEVRLKSCGAVVTITAINKDLGLYQIGRTVVRRFEFEPVKWDGDVIGNTGIGVCAKNGSEQC